MAEVSGPERCRCGHLRTDHRADEPEDHEECGKCDCTDFVYADKAGEHA